MQNIVRLLLFHAGSTTFAIDVDRVEQIVRKEQVTRAAHLPAHVAGLVNCYRHSSLPVLQLEEHQLPEQGQLDGFSGPGVIVIAGELQPTAVFVSAISQRLCYVQQQQIRQVNGQALPYASQVVEADGRVVPLLDITLLPAAHT